MLVASCYKNVFTRQFAFALRASSESLGIKCKLIDRADEKDLPGRPWKPAVILSTLRAYPQEDLFFTDPDTVIRRRPDILLDEKDFDVAAHYDVKTMALSGSIFVRNNAAGRQLVKRWGEINLALPTSADLENLSLALSNPQSPLAVRRLPATYAWVERLHRERHPAAEPVITHFMADSLSNRIRVLG